MKSARLTVVHSKQGEPKIYVGDVLVEGIHRFTIDTQVGYNGEYEHTLNLHDANVDMVNEEDQE